MDVQLCGALLAPLRAHTSHAHTEPRRSEGARRGTYVPYCKEDQGHAEDQGQHVAEGSESEHNGPGKVWRISPQMPLTDI